MIFNLFPSDSRLYNRNPQKHEKPSFYRRLFFFWGSQGIYF